MSDTPITADYLARIAPRLRAARESAGLSIGQAAKLANIMTAYNLMCLEDGTLPIQYVTDVHLDRLCEVYHVTREELDAEPIILSDDEMFAKIKAGQVDDVTFSLWIKIGRRLSQIQESSRE